MAIEILGMPPCVLDRAEALSLHMAERCSPPDFQHPSGSLAKPCGPPNETHRFCLTFAVLSDETMMDYFIVVTSVPDFFFQTHNRNILYCSDDERFYPPYIVTTLHQRASFICH